MAKAAVNGLTLALAAEFAPHIRVNAIAPSLTATPLAASLTNNPHCGRSDCQFTPHSTFRHSRRYRSVGVFLLSSDSSWLTGQILHVDGGRSTLRPKAAKTIAQARC